MTETRTITTARLSPEARAEWRAQNINHAHRLDGKSFPARCDICMIFALLDGLAAAEKHVDNAQRRLARYLHNHLSRDIKPDGQCPACDRGRAARRAEAADHEVKELLGVLDAIDEMWGDPDEARRFLRKALAKAGLR